MDRQSLDDKLRSMGYEHPESNNSNTSSYKTYNEFGKDTYTSQEYHMYASFSSKNNSANTQFCPKCERKASFVCTCEIGAMMCEKGHVWHVSKKGEVVARDPHV